jgi:hypothetical protein
MLMLLLAVPLTAAGPVPAGQGDQRGQRDRGGRGRPEGSKQQRLDFLAKMLALAAGAPEAPPECVFLNTRAGDLLERAKQSRGNDFQFDRLATATDNLLRAGERIFSARKFDRVDENERRDAALLLQKCYFRVQQAEYFAGISGEKESKQYVTMTRSLYQQARTAYDTRQYDRARMLGEASSLVVMALENIAHATLKIPDPPVIK